MLVNHRRDRPFVIGNSLWHLVHSACWVLKAVQTTCDCDCHVIASIYLPDPVPPRTLFLLRDWFSAWLALLCYACLPTALQACLLLGPISAISCTPANNGSHVTTAIYAMWLTVMLFVQAWRVPHPPARGHILCGTQPLVHVGFMKSWQAGGFNHKVITRIKELVYSRKATSGKLRIYVTGEHRITATVETSGNMMGMARATC